MCNKHWQTEETHCNPDAVYVPADGWWCRDCGVFRSVDDHDVCDDCRDGVALTGTIVPMIRRRGHE